MTDEERLMHAVNQPRQRDDGGKKKGAIQGKDGNWRMPVWPDGRLRTQWELGLED